MNSGTQFCELFASQERLARITNSVLTDFHDRFGGSEGHQRNQVLIYSDDEGGAWFADLNDEAGVRLATYTIQQAPGDEYCLALMFARPQKRMVGAHEEESE